MAKKIEVIEEVEEVKNKIDPFGVDLQRADLNALVRKVNEIIELINKL